MSLSAMRPVLVFGATGLLGKAICKELRARERPMLGAARSAADISVDIADASSVKALIVEVKPSAIINAAALVSLSACERDPDAAWAINADAVAAMSQAAELVECALVQISTDHFFTGDGRTRHDERAPVTLLNEYARSKFGGEEACRGYADALIVRTNFTGFRGDPRGQTFFEWALKALDAADPVTGFDDYFTSTLDASSCARALCDLLDRGVRGLVNVGASDVVSKYDYLRCLAEELGRDAEIVRAGSVRGLMPIRAESLGLDCTRAQAILDWTLPDTRGAIRIAIAEVHSNAI
jgi:dTDP-4-dehydrorhamnose reductase